MAMPLIVYVPPQQHPYTNYTRFFVPLIPHALRAAAVMGLEWTTLKFIEDAPLLIRIATFVVAVLILAALEKRDWLNFKGKCYFWTSVIVLLLLYGAVIGYSYFAYQETTASIGSLPSATNVGDGPLIMDWDTAMIGARQHGNTARLVPGAGEIVIEPGNGALQIDNFTIYAPNVSNININIERAYIVSDADQKPLSMDVSSPPGHFFNLREINPVAPSTTMLFKVGLSGMNETEFEKSWSSFTAVIEYNGKRSNILMITNGHRVNSTNTGLMRRHL